MGASRGCTVLGLRQSFLVVPESASVGSVVPCFWASGAEHAAVVDRAGTLACGLYTKAV